MEKLILRKVVFTFFLAMVSIASFASGDSTALSKCTVPKNAKEFTLQYNFITKQWVNTPKKWYPKNAHIRIQVLNVNQNAYDVNYELKNYSLDNNQEQANFINLFPQLKDAESTKAQTEVDSAIKEKTKIETEKPIANATIMSASDKALQKQKERTKQALQNAIVVNQNIIAINKNFDAINALIKVYNGAVSTLNNEKTVTNEYHDSIKKHANAALINLKSWVDSANAQTRSIIQLTDNTEVLLNSDNPFPTQTEGFNKAEKQRAVNKFREQANSFNADSLYLKILQLHRIVTNENNYTFFIPEFEAKGYEIETVVKYRQKASNGAFSTLTLPSLYTSANLRLGFGAGPLLVYIPGQHAYYKQEFRGVDSLNTKDSVTIISRKANNNLSFGLASFLDLDFQCSKTFSLGVGVGGGLNISERLDGNLYAGFNAGFRVAEKTQVSFRIGAAFAKTKILKDEYDSGVKYEKDFVTEEYTTTKWKVGVYAGITVNLLTRSLTATAEKQLVDK